MALGELQHVVVLVGGVGGAKLAYGLSRLLPPESLTVIVNVADDFWHYGLRICPDSDTIMYTLAERVDPVNGWGVAGDTANMLDALRTYGEEPWFRLGDRDLATHLLRTQMLHEGKRITEITRWLSMRLGLGHAILPVTDAPIATMIDTVEQGELEFQEYFVRYRWQPTVRAIRQEGIEAATLTPEVVQAIEQADALLVGPSNPWLSIEPILAVPGMRDLLRSRSIPRVAVTPIIEGRAVKGPAAKIMKELGYEVSAGTVVNFYGDVLNGFVNDLRNPEELGFFNVRVEKYDTMMNDNKDKINFARTLLAWLKGRTL